MTSNSLRYRGPWDCLSQTLASYGVRGVLTGLVSHWWRDGHGFGVYVVLYEALLKVCGGREDVGKMTQFWAGGLAGVLSAQLGVTILPEF